MIIVNLYIAGNKKTLIESCSLHAGGFTIQSALSFAAAFVLISIGISIFSFAGYKYHPLPEEDQTALSDAYHRQQVGNRSTASELKDLTAHGDFGTSRPSTNEEDVETRTDTRTADVMIRQRPDTV